MYATADHQLVHSAPRHDAESTLIAVMLALEVGLAVLILAAILLI